MELMDENKMKKDSPQAMNNLKAWSNLFGGEDVMCLIKPCRENVRCWI